MRRLVLAPILLAAASCGPDSASDGCKDKLLPGDLVITEVFADSKAPPGGSGTDEGKEWFEIYNASDRPLELKGLTITHSRPDDSKAKSHVMDDITVAPGQFLTLGNTTQELVAPYIDYGYSSDLGDFFNTDGGKLVLSCKSTEIDHATYESVKEGHSRQLSNSQPPDYTLNDDPNQWCQANEAEFETGNFGTPGSDSDCSPVVVGLCSDGGVMRDAVPPGVGDLVITEIMQKPKTISVTTGQWFEVLAKNDFDLNGVGLDRANDTAAATVISSSTCIHMRAGDYGVFARSSDPLMNGGITTLATFPFTLTPTTVMPDIQIVYGTTVIDAVTWTTSTTGKSLSLDPDSLTATGNDSVSNFCDGVAQYENTGPNSGTPGTANPQCATVAPPGMCDMGGGVLRPIVGPAAGALVITEFLADPAGTDTNKEWFEVTNTSGASFDLNELRLAHGGTGAATPAPIQSSTCLPVAPGAYALIAASSDAMANGGLPPPDATFGFGLTNTGTVSTGIKVLDGAGSLLDEVIWTTSTSGKSTSLDPDHINTTDNDMAVNFCPGVGGYGDLTNMGTPKAANPQCP